ncbi:L,D-transpeptidase family protein [Candidatus Kaiserbacteria bacterium]|nr:L,D-transpeptidase family protein [Candidatus Kaiserbacteria bacterium]
MPKRLRAIRLLSFSDDQPNEQLGSLIPYHVLHPEVTRTPQPSKLTFAVRAIAYVTLPAIAVIALLLLGTTSYGLFAKEQYALAPMVTLVDPNNGTATTLQYGPQVALLQPNFYEQTRDAFIEDSLTFIDVDFTSNQLRYFVDGVLSQSAEILAVGATGSWWETPAGLYTIQKVEERPFSSLGQVYLPNRITFEGNYMIHGIPEYPNGTTVAPEQAVGGIRLSNEAAAALAAVVEKGTPILVHDTVKSVDDFVYEPLAPEVGAKHYLIADIDNGTVLASSDLNAEAPIASVTKLMTAVVASEELDLDSRVWVTAPTFVQSLIPRLRDRTSVSLYSLMQLLLVESSNEASEVIAAQLGREQFITDMNARAKTLGMFHTTYADPSGLSSDNVSSLGDLYLLTKYIYENKRFIFEITANDEVQGATRGGDFAGLLNFNHVDGIDSFLGGKVGETEAAGQTSVSIHEIEAQGTTRQVAVILMGSSARTDDVTSLLNYAEHQFRR